MFLLKMFSEIIFPKKGCKGPQILIKGLKSSSRTQRSVTKNPVKRKLMVLDPIAEIGEHGSIAPEIMGPKKQRFLRRNFTHFLFVTKKKKPEIPIKNLCFWAPKSLQQCSHAPLFLLLGAHPYC